MKIGLFCLMLLAAGVHSDSGQFYQSLGKFVSTSLPNTGSSVSREEFGNPSEESLSEAFISACENRTGIDLSAKINSTAPKLHACLQDGFQKILAPSGEFFSSTCSTLKELLGCSIKYLHVDDVCYPETDTGMAPAILKERMFEAGVNFACDDGARHLRQFFAENGPQCFEEKRQPLRTCLDTYQEDILKSSYSIMTAEDYPPSSRKLRVEYCRTYVSLRNCFMAELPKCPNRFPITLLEKVTDEVSRLLSCEEFAPCELDQQCKNQSRWSFSKKSS